MSGKLGSIGSIVLGAVIVVASAYSSNVGGVVAGIAMIGGGVAGLTMKQQLPKAQTAEAAKAEDLQFANSSEGFPVPVVFGEQKVTPNFMDWRDSTFRSVEGTIPAGGKGGGGKKTQPNGVIDYYLTFEVGICVGQVDEIGQIISVPGDILTRGKSYTAGNGLQATKSGITVTTSPVTAFFSTDTIGGKLTWADGTVDTITGLIDSARVRVAASGTKTAQRFSIYKPPEQIVFDDDYSEIVLSGINEGGLVRVYRGSQTQTRISANDPYEVNGMNYRGLCWALFIDFWIGRGSPTPKTYQFIVRRFPKCIRDNDTTVTGILTRGSINPADLAYNQANPAAVIYEILTNKFWGRGISSDLLDEASFIRCSQFFRTKNIGISLTLDAPEKLTSVLDSIRQQLKIILSWNGGQWKMRCLLDPSQVAESIQTLTSDEIDELRVTRPMWTATVNDLRAEYNSSEKLYKADVIHVQNQANLELAGRTNTMTISLRAFSDWNAASRQAVRMLMEASYPAASVSFMMNRFRSRLEIGDTFRIVWREWGSDAVTGYFTALKIEPQGKDDDRIKVMALEDSFLSAIAGVESSVEVPTIMPWEKIKVIDYGDLSLRQTPDSQNGAIYPVMAIEIAVAYSTRINFFGLKPSPGTIGAQIFWSPLAVNNYLLMSAAIMEWCVMGSSATAINDVKGFDRSESFMEVNILNAADAATILAFNITQSPEAHLENLERADGGWLIIGEEIIKVGLVEQITSTQFRLRNVIRGMMGTEITTHPASTTVALTNSIGFGMDLYANGTNGLPITSPPSAIKFRAYPQTSAGTNQVGEDFYPYHEGIFNNQLLLGIGGCGRPAELISVARSVGGAFEFVDYVVRLRRRFDWAGCSPFFGEYNATLNKMTGLLAKLDADYESFYTVSPSFTFIIDNSLTDTNITKVVTYLGGGKFKIAVSITGGVLVYETRQAAITYSSTSQGVKPSPLPFYATPNY